MQGWQCRQKSLRNGKPSRCSRSDSVTFVLVERVSLQIVINYIQMIVLIVSLDVDWALPLLFMAEATGLTEHNCASH